MKRTKVLQLPVVKRAMLRELDHDNPLTKGELDQIEKEITALDKAVSSTDNDDLLDSYQDRLEVLCAYLERSITITERIERGLRAV